ncbi:MAG: hypothetical protein IPK84_05185 [Candidatus Moraniibacteriota bacterium]|nr:MAG: hypothetical protein IPK84_05185 [Candidatus Moranbacteria bacterium]
MAKKVAVSGRQYESVIQLPNKFFEIVSVVHISRKGKNGKKKKRGGHFLEGSTSEPPMYFLREEAENELKRFQSENPDDQFEVRCRGVIVRGKAYFT